jgi:D-alanyl-D-alanine carboxypeptidase
MALLSGCSVPREPVPPVGASTPPPSPTATPTPTPIPTPTPTFDRAKRSIDAADSVWVVANKRRPLQPETYAPADLVRVDVPYTNEPFLRAAAAAAAEKLFAAAEAEAGLRLQSLSTYRSYSTQVRVYNDIVASRGQDYANRRSAQPGHSEHQTGLSIDIGSIPASCAFDPCFGDTAHGRWLAENAWRFGFHLRYPQGGTPVTGYDYEPWHYRYVGLELAAELHETGIPTLEEFFGLPAAPDYGG